MSLALLVIVGAPILPLDPSGRQIGHFRDLKLAAILKASFQNWLVSRNSDFRIGQLLNS